MAALGADMVCTGAPVGLVLGCGPAVPVIRPARSTASWALVHGQRCAKSGVWRSC